MKLLKMPLLVMLVLACFNTAYSELVYERTVKMITDVVVSSGVNYGYMVNRATVSVVIPDNARLAYLITSEDNTWNTWFDYDSDISTYVVRNGESVSTPVSPGMWIPLIFRGTIWVKPEALGNTTDYFYIRIETE